jgi:glycosyltransferase involved in cell wall biosynthesis
MDPGGAETFLMKVFRNVDIGKLKFDFLVCTPEEGRYDKEILSMGGMIYLSAPKSKNPVKSFYDTYKLVRTNQYKAVFRASAHSLAFLDLFAAVLGGARVRVIRSTNTNNPGGGISNLLHILFRPLLNNIATFKIAPSTEAAVWLFGKNSVRKGEATIIKNGVEIDKFIFNEDMREKKRRDMGFSGRFVIGHIGRFQTQKNHKYLLDIFSVIRKKQENAVLLLIGHGELESVMKEKAEKYGLADSVVFAGHRTDIPDLLMAMDIYIFPSLYEGLPNTVVEAQATALRCLVSDSVTKEVGFTSLVEFLPLEMEPYKWADIALQYRDGYERRNMKEEFIEKGYDIRTTAKWLEEYFLSNAEDPAPH